MSSLCQQTFANCPQTFANCPQTFANCPAASASCHTASVNCPTASVNCPTASVNCPTASANCPTASVNCPTASVNCPTASVNCPTASVDCPTASADCPTASADCPTASVNCHTASVNCHTASANGPIIFIASVDLVTDVLCIPVILCVLRQGFQVKQRYLCKLLYFLNFSTAAMSVLGLVVVAYVRYRKVCFPFGSHISPRQARVLCGLLALACLVVCIPQGVVHGLQTIIQGNVTGHMCRIDDRLAETGWPVVVNGSFLVIFFACSTALVFMYFRIGIVAWRHGSLYGMSIKYIVQLRTCNERTDRIRSTRPEDNVNGGVSDGALVLHTDLDVSFNANQPDSALFGKFRKSESKWSVCSTELPEMTRAKRKSVVSVYQRHNGKTTRMLLVISAAYIVTNMTSLVLIIARTADPGLLFRLTTGEASLFNVFVASYLINTAVNPVIYSLWDRGFRQHFRQVMNTN
ncbi:hypothetical protein Btru_050672 [Bulinus truncatus]|nr:hypothetical protein Btru_050672 [Bulinus truncatus]